MRKLTTESFIQKAKDKHGDKYDYSKVRYELAHTKVIVTCPEHGDFAITPANHLVGKGCPQCWINNRSAAIKAGKARIKATKEITNETINSASAS